MSYLSNKTPFIKLAMKSLSCWLAVSFLFILSCTEDEQNRLHQTPFKDGNYWIYQTKVTSASERVTIFQPTDSAWISGDTVINNKKYMVQMTTLNGSYNFRDSADCLILRYGNLEHIISSSNPDTLYRYPPYYLIMTSTNEKTSVPAGVFQTSVCSMLIRNSDETQNYFPRFNKNFVIYQQFYVSPDIGLIKRVDYYLGTKSEYELTRFRIQ